MLPTNRRVKKAFFAKIMKDGPFLHSENFYLRFLDRKDGLVSTFSFVVPVKIKKTSVGRHLIKRKMSAVVEKKIFQIKPGRACLIFAKKDISLLPQPKIEEEIVNLLQKSYTL